MDIFMGIGKLLWYEILICEKFCWICDVGSWKICIVMILAENFFVHELVEILILVM